MIREGNGEPLVLLHGVTGSSGHWEEVVPILAPEFDTVALDALGHHDGEAATSHPVLHRQIVDDCERKLDELGLEKPHVAGNSMGGWTALELARRGRARSVCAFSPAGTWDPSGQAGRRSREGLRGTARDARRFRRLLPLLVRSAAMRRFAMRQNAVQGDRMKPQAIVDRTDDLLACTVLDDMLDTSEYLEPLDPPPCPITIAWSRKDRVLPLKDNGERAREMVPGARFLVLEDVGHVPMFDDPGLVARTILEATRPRP